MAAVEQLITPEDYLNMAFDGPDCEYVHGAIIPRAMPALTHSKIQVHSIKLFLGLKSSFPLEVFTDPRHRLQPGVFRIPDVSVHLREPSTEVPSTPPYIVIEIISPDDRHGELTTKLEEYEQFGVEHIWVINPLVKGLFVYRAGSLLRTQAFEIPEHQIVIPKSEFFPDPNIVTPS